MKYLLSLIIFCLIYFQSLSQVKTPNSDIKTDWTLISKSFKGETVTLSFSANIPKDWVLQTEDLGNIGIPMVIESDQIELVDTIIIKHTIKDEVANVKLMNGEIDNSKFVANKTTFTIIIKFKPKKRPKEFKGNIVYWMNNEDKAIYPLKHTFEVKMN